MSPRFPLASCWLPTALLVLIGASEASAYSGFGLFRRGVETVYVPSSGSILLEPTAYYVPTTYVDYVPTVYATTAYVPTSYLVSSTAYIRPTTYYAPTRYVVRRPVVDTSSTIVERAYYLPTTVTYDLPVVRTSSSAVCCEDSLTFSDTIVSEAPSGTVIRDEPAYELPPDASEDDLPLPGPLNSGSTSAQPRPTEPDLDPGVIRSTPRQPPATRPNDSPPAATPSQTPADSLVEPDLPAQPAPDAFETNPPLPPPANEVLPIPAATSGDQQRTSLRPTYSRPLAQARSALLGKVVSAVSGEPEEGVLITLADRSGRFVARTITTGSDGSFSVVLPEGDWSVTVPKPGDPAGESTIDRYITVSGGVITDDQDREVTMLTINR